MLTGDFTKNVSISLIAMKMIDLVSDRKDLTWKHHFEVLSRNSGLDYDSDAAATKLLPRLKLWAKKSRYCRRTYLQTRFFETGDNYYLGMEYPREFDDWKQESKEKLCPSILSPTQSHAKQSDAYKKKLENSLDRLWFTATLEVIRTGDVYNPGARNKVPVFFLVDSYGMTHLSNVPVGEAFNTSAVPNQRYEVMIKPLPFPSRHIICRDVEGKILKLARNTMVCRQGNLTRGPNGIRESNVALASFPVHHLVNHRTMRISRESRRSLSSEGGGGERKSKGYIYGRCLFSLEPTWSYHRSVFSL